jgi:hypothetical protein
MPIFYIEEGLKLSSQSSPSGFPVCPAAELFLPLII